MDRYPILSTQSLAKSHGRKVLVHPTTMEILPGEVCALIGPNGAGKTTLLKTVCGFVQPTSGTVLIDGQPLTTATRTTLLPRIGVVIGPLEVPKRTTARQVLERHLRLMGRSGDDPVEPMLRRVGLDYAADLPVNSFSLGMKQRLSIARALAHGPSLLILDEPTNGLDRDAVDGLNDILTEIAAQGHAVILSTHVRSDISLMARTAYIMHRGQLGRKFDLTTMPAEGPGSLDDAYRAATTGGHQ
ncbi:ABC transporter ATP-binding protein [Corynebacterium bovis]|uniref:ABC transporter ATP-binding protein n=1 Tax=Corynebacterium bovis TaxID=36808 RepID=UPI00254A4FB2|nr:ABC transporter ATP-binding protein [Corynebacterium bovis]MDK8511091.1 ABC transporter ATP-binding protein [Corynebacterium bovis]